MVSAKVLHSLLNKIWNEEDIPQHWKLGLLVKLPKKGDLCLCKTWRGIMLLTVVSKVLCKAILERMKNALEILLRPDSCTEDHSGADLGVEHWATYGFRGL